MEVKLELKLCVCIECPRGTYGPGCQLTCQCSGHSSACDHVTGTCSCNPGYQGIHCQTACPTGLYGPDCAQQCFCDNGARCDHVTGACSCSAGWTGPGCQYPCSVGSWGPGCNEVRSSLTQYYRAWTGAVMTVIFTYLLCVNRRVTVCEPAVTQFLDSVCVVLDGPGADVIKVSFTLLLVVLAIPRYTPHNLIPLHNCVPIRL